MFFIVLYVLHFLEFYLDRLPAGSMDGWAEDYPRYRIGRLSVFHRFEPVRIHIGRLSFFHRLNLCVYIFSVLVIWVLQSTSLHKVFGSFCFNCSAAFLQRSRPSTKETIFDQFLIRNTHARRVWFLQNRSHHLIANITFQLLATRRLVQS